jgi:hypothetical protein
MVPVPQSLETGTAKHMAGYRETAMAEGTPPADGRRIGKAKHSLSRSAGRPTGN